MIIPTQWRRFIHESILKVFQIFRFNRFLLYAKKITENGCLDMPNGKQATRKAIICSKLTIETLEQGVKFVQN